MTRRKLSELLTFGRLAREQEGLRVFSFATDFERTEVLVPEPIRGIGIRFSPRFELVKVFGGDLAFAQPIKEVIAERGRQTAPPDSGALLTEGHDGQLLLETGLLFHIARTR